MKTDLFQSCGHCWVFQICWHIEYNTLTASSFRIWNRSAGIPSPSLALFIVMLPKAHLTLDSRMSGSRWVITVSKLSGSLRPFLYSSFLYSYHLFLISSASFQFSSAAQSCLFATPWTTARQASLSFTISWSLLRLMSIESVMPSSHLILCHPLLFCHQSFQASGSFPMSQFFAKVAKVLEFQLQHQSFPWIFRTDFL